VNHWTPNPGQPWNSVPNHQVPNHQVPNHQVPHHQVPNQQVPAQPYPQQFRAGGYPGPGPYPGPPAGYPARPIARYPAPPPTAPKPRKRWLAVVVGLAVVAGLAAAAVVLGQGPAPVRVPDTGTVQQPGTLSVFELQAGDCYNSTQTPPPPGQSQPISVVEAVQCTAPHTNQVIGKISYSPTEFTAGVPAEKADADCSGEFQAKLDPAAFSDPTLKPGRLNPADAATWARTPVVACVVFSDQPISRSLLR
jgi:hypothetical protein